jgi:hypothetical protein
MTNGEIHGISHELGILSARFEAVLVELKDAAHGRTRLFDRIEGLSAQVGTQLSSMNTRVDRVVERQDQIESTLKAIEPAMKNFSDETLRQEGAKRLGVRLWGVMMAAAGAMGWGIHEIFVLFWKH